jgi:hypothetical protein
MLNLKYINIPLTLQGEMARRDSICKVCQVLRPHVLPSRPPFLAPLRVPQKIRMKEAFLSALKKAGKADINIMITTLQK